MQMNRVVCYSGDYGGAVGTYMCDCKTINCIMRCKNMNLLGSGLRVHSVNPYTALFFNPWLDWIFRSNVAHQIHHVVQMKNFAFFPLHHIFANNRLSDMKEYDKIMKTNFFSDY